MDYKKRRNRKNNCSSTVAVLQKSNALMKTMNRDLALNMQRLKEEISKYSAQNASLKADLYDMMMERNSLMEKNMNLVELLRTVQADILSVGQKIEDKIDPERQRSTIKQNNPISPMVSGQVIHNPKLELKKLDFNDFPDASRIRGLKSNDAINLSPILEEQYLEDMVPRRLGHRLRFTKKVTSLGKRGFSDDSFYSDSTCRVADTSENGGTFPENINFETSDPRVSSTAQLNSTVLEETPYQTGNNGKVEGETESSGNRLSVDEIKNTADTRRNSTTVLTINLMSQKNGSQSSENPINPSVFVNVFPRKKKYRSSINGTPSSSTQTKNYEDQQNEKKNVLQSGVAENKRGNVISQSQPLLMTENDSCDIRTEEDFSQCRFKRRSSRIRKIVNYKHIE